MLESLSRPRNSAKSFSIQLKKMLTKRIEERRRKKFMEQQMGESWKSHVD